MIRVCVLADSNDRAETLSRLLEEDNRFEISDGELADVILCIGISRQRWPRRGKPVVAIGTETDDASPFDETVKAWLPYSSNLKDISAALTAADASLTVLTNEQARRTFRNKPAVEESLDELEHLTTREQEVLQMMAAGAGNKEIASRLKISPNTAKFHVRQIMAKLNAESRTEAVTLAIRRGLVPI